VTVDGLGAAVTVWVSTRIGDREGFCVVDRDAVGSSVGVGSSAGRLDESAGLGFVGVGLGISGRVADLVGVGRDTVGVGSWLAERDGDSGTSMFPPPAHEVSTAMATAKPAIFMTGVPTLPPDPASLHTPPPDMSSIEPRYGPACRVLTSHRSVVRLSHVETELPATHVRHELIKAGMLITAGGFNCKPLDYGKLERWTRVDLRTRQDQGVGGGEGPLAFSSGSGN
jgi:hypothetical protein